MPICEAGNRVTIPFGYSDQYLFYSLKVPVTNFFGSVMETIHTDSAYKALSGKSLTKADVKISPDKSTHDDHRKIIEKSDGLDQISDPKPTVTARFPFSAFIYIL